MDFGPVMAAVNPTVALSTGSQIASGLISAASARDANAAMAGVNEQTLDYNASQAAIGREWEEHMSSTAWQRATGDMKTAGINPMLAVSQGPASTPGAPTASVGNLKSPNAVPSALEGVASSAVDALRLTNETRRNNAEIANVQADTANKILDSPNISAKTRQIAAQTAQAAASASSIASGIAGRESESWSLKNQTDIERLHPQFWGWFNAIMSKMPFVNSAASAGATVNRDW